MEKRKKKGLIFLERIMKNLLSALAREKLLSPLKELLAWSFQPIRRCYLCKCLSELYNQHKELKKLLGDLTFA